MESFNGIYDGIVKTLNRIPGVNIETRVIEETVVKPTGKTAVPGIGMGENTQKLIVQHHGLLPGQSQTLMTQPNGILPGQPQAMISPVKALKPPETEGVLTGGKKQGIGKQGLMKEVTTHSQTITDNSRRFENVKFNVANGMTPEQLTEWEHVAYG